MVIIAQIFIAAVHCEEESHSRKLKTLLELHKEYLSNEENLWQRINRILANSPNVDANILHQTSIEALMIHRNVFFENTFDTTSYWNSYLLFGIGHFRDYLTNINDTLEDNYRYLYDESEQIKFNPLDIEKWTHDTMFDRLRANSMGLYSLTVDQKDIVFQHIQTVSVARRQYSQNESFH